jgi:ATP-dependent Clp protease ATP-binding subunit ClpC
MRFPSGRRGVEFASEERPLKDLELPLFFRGGLESYTRDLTAAALRDELEPVRCRDREIERVITALMRQSKNNPVLVGDAGVGKTAIVEGLAQRVALGRVPLPLKTCRILSLSHIDLIAGTTFRGQYERRLQSVIQEASGDATVLLFIDELHNLIGAGTAFGAPMDAANMLKPSLAAGHLRVIGATTHDEYDRFIRSDSALERRFQPVEVRELDRAETLEVLRARRPRLELHHLFAITDEALEAAADLSNDYLPNRLQPDRSIDLLDESCARVRMARGALPEPIAELRRERARLVELEQAAIRQVLALATARGTPIERISRGTFRAIEALGSGLEKLVTGKTTPRPPLPRPDSVRRLERRDPAGQLARIHCERLRIEDRLRSALICNALTIDRPQVQATLA